MTPESWPARAARILPLHGLSTADYYLLCTAGYRINVDRDRFVRQAAWEFQGGWGWPDFTIEQLGAALTRLIEAGLIQVLTEADIEAEKERRTKSYLPEIGSDIDYRAGHVDFTNRGYSLYREVATAICGEFSDSLSIFFGGENRSELYATSEDACRRLMQISESTEGGRVVERIGPTRIGPWRPNRFIVVPEGYHGRLIFEAPDDPSGSAIAPESSEASE
jgi:hypothetical protein